MNTAILFLALVPLAPDPDIRVKKEIDELIAKLGHPDYKLREQAAKRLMEIGPVASEAIKAGQMSSDIEIGERCKKLYPLLWTLGLEKRLQKFVNAEGNKDSEELPLVKKWLDIVGGTKASRELYANMVRAHSDKLKTVEEQPDRGPTVLAEFAKLVYVRSTGASAVKATSLLGEQDVSLFMFLGAVGEVRRTTLPGMSSTYYYQFLNSEWLTKSLDAETPSKEVRTLFARWLEKERYSIVIRRSIELAGQHKVTECIPVVLKIAGDTNTTPFVRAAALLGFSKLGTKDNLKDLEPFLNDTLHLANVTVNGVSTKVQMGDVALGTALLLTGQSPKEFGFEREPPTIGTLTSYTYYGFSSDEKREAAHQKWKDWAKVNLKK
ncbi:HEAT repeat domain-containing protein [Zavarzinella formosa]|uniref:HEAT repeat domain-containing protein n=1 Tax=Zavarzinella formosa TaxID=360055 RepID=UPI0002D4D438|nr:HEAT repeat domain-containing protein [Zavarzinella formosa]